MKRIALVTLLLSALPALAQAPSPAPTRPGAEPAQARADLLDAKGRPAGSVTLMQTPEGVKLKITVIGLDAGKHGIHVHEVGKCEAPDFKSAGGHFNPMGKHHGMENPQGAHAGDLPNLVASADGMASGDMLLKGVTLEPGAKNSLLDADGSAIVVHAGEDDEKSDPAGNSGARVACGVVAPQ